METTRVARNRGWRVATALVSTAGLLAVSVIASAPVFADNYPSWDDVVAARSTEAGKSAEIDRINGLVSGLEAQVSAAKALAAARWTDNQTAQIAFNEAAVKSDQLAAQATKAQATANASHRLAAVLAAQFARSGGNDLSTRLFVDGEHATDLLYQLGAMSKLSETTAGVYQQAERDQNTASALGEQATVAKEALGRLAASAQSALADAVTAQQSVQAALVEQQSHETQLSVQLQALTQGLYLTEAAYQAGVEEAQRARQAADEAAYAATHPQEPSAPGSPGDSGTGDSGTGDGGAGDGGGSPAPPPPVVNPPQSVDGDAVVAYAEQFVGVVPYGNGADPSDSFGCDGLTQYVYRQFGISLPRYVPIQASYGVRVSSADARAGDAVVWSGHIGIYDGQGGVIHSPDWGRYVTHAHSLWGSYYFVRFL